MTFSWLQSTSINPFRVALMQLNCMKLLLYQFNPWRITLLYSFWIMYDLI
jgi:hypothetical protein